MVKYPTSRTERTSAVVTPTLRAHGKLGLAPLGSSVAENASASCARRRQTAFALTRCLHKTSSDAANTIDRSPCDLPSSTANPIGGAVSEAAAERASRVDPESRRWRGRSSSPPSSLGCKSPWRLRKVVATPTTRRGRATSSNDLRAFPCSNWEANEAIMDDGPHCSLSRIWSTRLLATSQFPSRRLGRKIRVFAIRPTANRGDRILGILESGRRPQRRQIAISRLPRNSQRRGSRAERRAQLPMASRVLAGPRVAAGCTSPRRRGSCSGGRRIFFAP